MNKISPIDKEYLIEQYVNQRKSVAKISRDLNCSKQSIFKRLQQLDIAKPPTIKPPDIYELYKLGNNTQQICSVLHISQWMLRKILRGYDKPRGMGRGTARPKENWEGYKEITSDFWSRINKSASERNLRVEITAKDAWEILNLQSFKCALSGIDLYLSKNRQEQITGKTTASLDRIDSSKEYSKDNVQWVHKIINKMKGTLPDQEFIEFCKMVAKHDISRE